MVGVRGRNRGGLTQDRWRSGGERDRRTQGHSMKQRRRRTGEETGKGEVGRRGVEGQAGEGSIRHSAGVRFEEKAPGKNQGKTGRVKRDVRESRVGAPEGDVHRHQPSTWEPPRSGGSRGKGVESRGREGVQRWRHREGRREPADMREEAQGGQRETQRQRLKA